LLVVSKDSSLMKFDKFALDQQSQSAFSTIVSFVENYIQYLSSKDTFQGIISDAFGADFNKDTLERLTSEWKRGNFASLPTIESRTSAELQGAYGAYASDGNTIYLSESFVSANRNSPQKLIEVLLEEVGHFLDAELNTKDSPGDEGAIFAGLITGKEITEAEYQALRKEDDSAVIILDNQAVAVEQASKTVSDSGGFEGSQQTLDLGSKNGAIVEFSYEHFFIPDNFILRYEGRNVLETGFVGGRRSGKVSIPKGNSESLEVIVATNDEGTAWNYTVTATPCADTAPLIVESPNGFEDTDDDGDCDATGTVTIGHEAGAPQTIRIENSDTEYDDTSIRVKSGTVFAAIGGVSESLFSGNFEIPTGSTKASVFNPTRGDFKLGGLETDFTSLVILKEGLGLGARFQLPDTLGNILVDSISAPGPDALIIGQNGVRLGSSGKVSLPNPPKFSFFKLFDVEASDLSLEYQSPENRLKFQGKFELDSFVKDTFVNKVTADLSGNNFVQIEDGEADLVGSLKVDTDLKTKSGWGLSNIELNLDTVNNEVGGAAEITFPFKAKIKQTKFELGFKTSPFELDKATVSVDSLNIPIPQAPGVFLQELKGGVDNLSPSDKDPTEFIGGTAFTLGPQSPPINIFNGTFAEFSIPSTSLFRVDLDGKINENRANGTGKAVLLSDKILSSQGEVTLNWDKGFYEFKGSKSILDGLIRTNDSFKLNTNFDLRAGGGASVGIPGFIPLVGGANLASGNYLLDFTNDSNYSNDFGAGWGTVQIQKFGLEASFTVGFKAFFDGRFERIGSKNIPETNSFIIEPDTPWVVMGADWENDANGDVPLVVITPDGTVITEEEFGPSNGIAVVEELSDSTTKAVIVFNPQAGVWDIQVTDDTGLGQVSYTAAEESDIPTLEVISPAATVTDSEVLIEYNAFDADSDAQVSLFYDDDSSGFDGVLIEGDLAETDSTGSFVWDTEGLAPGDYFVYGLAVDENNPPVFDYAPGKVTVTEATDLAVTQTVDDSSILPGETYTYTVTVENNSSTTSKEVSLEEVLPEEVTVLSTSVTPSSQVGNTLSFDLGDLKGGDITSIDITVKAPNTPGSLSGSATVQTRTYDSDLTNDIDLFTTVIEELPAEELPDLAVTRIDQPDSVEVGDSFTYTLEVTNNGPGKADSVILQEDYTEGLNVVNFTPIGSTTLTNLGSTSESFTLGLGALESGETASFEVEVVTSIAGNFVNTTEVTALGQSDTNVFDNLLTSTKQVLSAAPQQVDLELVQSADNLTPSTGDTVNLTLSLTNNGPGVASGIVVEELLPSGLSLISAFAEQGSYDSSTGVWDVGNIRDNLTRTLTIQTEVTTSGPISITSEVTALNEVDSDSTPGNGVETEDDQDTLVLNSSTTPPTKGNTLTGSPDSDRIFGTEGDDRIRLFGDDDVASGKGGDDNLLGDDGNDRLLGGDGNDRLLGGEGNDRLLGGNGADTLLGGDGADRLLGGDGADRLLGEEGNDVLQGNAGDDMLLGGLGNDRLLGGADSDRLLGGEGNDRLLGGNGADTLLGGDGADRLLGGDSADRLLGEEGNDVLLGNAGNDVLIGGLGDDVIEGGEGDDILRGGEGSDKFILSAASGFDIIKDFEVGVDLIALTKGLTFGALSLERKNNGLLIQLDGDVLAQVEGVASLDSSNFRPS